MSSVAVATNGTKPKSPMVAFTTVQDFFKAVNWDDSPPAVQESKLSAAPGAPVELSYALSVHQFFAAVNWDGAAIAALPSPAPVEPAPAPVDNFTLDDFSDLF